jgi:hypothetical protein
MKGIFDFLTNQGPQIDWESDDFWAEVDQVDLDAENQSGGRLSFSDILNDISALSDTVLNIKNNWENAGGQNSGGNYIPPSQGSFASLDKLALPALLLVGGAFLYKQFGNKATS